MRMDLSLYQKLEMRMRLAPQIIQSIEILQLPTLELQQRLNKELTENPVLEQEEVSPESESDEEVSEREERIAENSEIGKMLDLEERLYEHSSMAPASRREYGEKDAKHEAMLNTAARSKTLPEHLAEQLRMLQLDPTTFAIAENIVYNLDENGYLQHAIAEIVDSMPKGTTTEHAERVLLIVQSLDPPGVAARDLKECLLLQLRDTDPHVDLVRHIIKNHLEDLAANRLPKIVKEANATLEEVQKAAEIITCLSPKPGAIYSSLQPHYVVPDLSVIKNEEGEYEVILNDAYIPRLHLNRSYIRMLEDNHYSIGEKEYIRQKLQSARWMIDAIEQRRKTLHKIMVEISERQVEFLEKGIHFLHPLRMSDVAKTVGVHVSTVSRAIANKYVQTPRGLYEIRFFFTGSASAPTEAGGEPEESRQSVQELVREMVEKEDKSNPLSDLDILNKLKEKGIDIARRTITKYRRILNIPSSRQRMRY